jgi:hypothetical protein
MTFIAVGFGACATSEHHVSGELSSKPETWAGSMQGLKQSLQSLLPTLFDTQEFYRKESEGEILRQLSELSSQSKNVSHNPSLPGRDPTVRFLATDLEADLELVRSAFAEGKKEFARFQLMKVTQYCVECHTRTQQGPELKGSAGPFFNSMSSLNQVEYLIAFRDFDRAIEVSQQALRSATPQLKLLWQLDRVAKLGLQVSIQYKNSYKDAQKIIETVQGNSALPLFLRSKAKAWSVSLKKLQTQVPDKDELVAARNLLSDDSGEIERMRALSLLLRTLSRQPGNDVLAEALYLTGRAYEELNESSISLHENYYESCIRERPRSKWSKLCFEKLEQSIAMGYTGSSGTHLPLDVHVRLEKLRSEAL